MEKLGPWIFYECNLTQDFPVIPDYLSFAPPKLTDKNKAIKHYLMCFHDFYASQKHFGNPHRMAKNLMKSASLGHLKSRENLCQLWLLRPDTYPELNHKTIKSWIDSILDTKVNGYTIRHGFYVDFFWADREKVFEEYRLTEIKRMNHVSDDNFILPLKDGTSVDLYGIPKMDLVHLRDTLLNYLSDMYRKHLMQCLEESNDTPTRIILGQHLNFYMWPKPQKGVIQIRISCQGIHLSNIKLDISNQKEIDVFVSDLNHIINYSSLTLVDKSKQILAFADNADS